MEETKKVKIREILQNEANIKELAGKNSMEEITQFFCEKNVDFSDEDLKEVQEISFKTGEMIQNGELTEKELEETVGGTIGSFINLGLDLSPGMFKLAEGGRSIYGVLNKDGKGKDKIDFAFLSVITILSLALLVKSSKDIIEHPVMKNIIK